MLLRRLVSLTLIALFALLAGCSSEPESTTLAAAQPIDAGDSCHVCGMLIKDFAGPKGEAFMHGRKTALKFCSTMDLFSFVLQPENETQVSHAYVHDMSAVPWDKPSDDAFVRATEAWYVVGHDLPGAMGPTLASFARREAADAFAQKHGGEVIAYTDITLELLGRLGRGEAGQIGGDEVPMSGSTHGSMPKPQ